MASAFSHPDAVEAFQRFEKPAAYIEPDLYEPERDEYEQMLGSKSREQIQASDFGTGAWGPFCYLTPEAMAYLLPRLMELAASGTKDAAGELFMMRFINRFSEGPSDSVFSLLGAQHRVVVAAFLSHVASEHGALVESECWDDVLVKGIRNWCAA